MAGTLLMILLMTMVTGAEQIEIDGMPHDDCTCKVDKDCPCAYDNKRNGTGYICRHLLNNVDPPCQWSQNFCTRNCCTAENGLSYAVKRLYRRTRYILQEIDALELSRHTICSADEVYDTVEEMCRPREYGDSCADDSSCRYSNGTCIDNICRCNNLTTPTETMHITYGKLRLRKITLCLYFVKGHGGIAKKGESCQPVGPEGLPRILFAMPGGSPYVEHYFAKICQVPFVCIQCPDTGYTIAGTSYSPGFNINNGLCRNITKPFDITEDRPTCGDAYRPQTVKNYYTFPVSINDAPKPVLATTTTGIPVNGEESAINFWPMLKNVAGFQNVKDTVVEAAKNILPSSETLQPIIYGTAVAALCTACLSLLLSIIILIRLCQRNRATITNLRNLQNRAEAIPLAAEIH